MPHEARIGRDGATQVLEGGDAVVGVAALGGRGELVRDAVDGNAEWRGLRPPADRECEQQEHGETQRGHRRRTARSISR